MMGGLRSVTREPGFPTREEVASLYARLSGRDVSNLEFYRGVRVFQAGRDLPADLLRWYQGQTHDARFEGLGDVAAWMVRRASRTAGLARPDAP